MKELFREHDFTQVSFYRSILETAGIPTFIRNETLTMSGLTEIPIPEFYPALCVVNDEDYERALSVLREHNRKNQENADSESLCPFCGESSPGNFEVCWSCGGSLVETLL